MHRRQEPLRGPIPRFLHLSALTLDQTAVLLEFEDDADARTHLIEVATTDPTQFEHTAQSLRDNAAEKARFAAALVFKYERTGPVAHVWGLWRVTDVDGHVLREWEDEPGDMTDESEEELVALDLIINRAATLHATDYGTPTGTAATVLHTLTL